MNYAEFNDRVLSIKVAPAGHKPRSAGGGFSPNYSFEVASAEPTAPVEPPEKAHDSPKAAPKVAETVATIDNSVPAGLLAAIVKIGGEIVGKRINPAGSYELEAEETEKLEVAIKDVMDYYSIGKMHPVLALTLCVGSIYGPRFALAYFENKGRNEEVGAAPNPNITKLERKPAEAPTLDAKLNREEFREFAKTELISGKSKRSILLRAGFARNEAFEIINQVESNITSNVTSNVTSNDETEYKHATS